MTLSVCLVCLYFACVIASWCAASLLWAKRRRFLLQVSPIYKDFLGFAWEPQRWLDRLRPLDGYKLKQVRAHPELVPIALKARYESLVRLEFWSFWGAIMAVLLICPGLYIVKWLE